MTIKIPYREIYNSPTIGGQSDQKRFSVVIETEDTAPGDIFSVVEYVKGLRKDPLERGPRDLSESGVRIFLSCTNLKLSGP